MLALKENWPWYVDIVKFLSCNVLPPELNSRQRNKFLYDVKCYEWDDPLLFCRCADQVIRRRVPKIEYDGILAHCHFSQYGGHMGPLRTTRNILDSEFYWPTLFRDSVEYVKKCDHYQRVRNISKRDEMPLHSMLEVEIFDIWGIDFMRLFPPSKGNLYILMAVDYVSKWVKSIATPRNDVNTVVNFFFRKNILNCFGTPKEIVSDKGIHFYNKVFSALMAKCGVHHKKALAYHPQANGQAKITNREIKKIMEKTVSINIKDWAMRIDE